jgi:hypothetical protein
MEKESCTGYQGGLKMQPLKFETDDMLNIIETFPASHPAYISAMRQMIDLSPKDVQDKFHAEAMAILGNPEPDGYDIHGQPVYNSETMAHCTGIPLADIESQAIEYEKLYGKVQVDKRVTVLKQSEVEYKLTAHAVLLLTLMEWSDGNEKVIPMLEGWFKLALERGCKPIIVVQLKHLIRAPGWKRNDVERYLNRIYKFTPASEFLTDFMKIKPIERS